MKNRMSYISLYIKRLFTKDFKKQLFLIIGIAAFMTSLSRRVILGDSWQGYWKNMIAEEQWGFTHKIYDVSDEMMQYLETQEGIEQVDILEKVALKSGINHADWIAPVNLPERWGIKLLYGTMPQKGEILLTEDASIGNRQPVLGEAVTLSLKVGGEVRELEVRISGVAENMVNFVGEYAFLCQEDFENLTGEVPEEKMCRDVFVQAGASDDDDGTFLFDLYDKFGAYQVLIWGMAGVEPEYEWGEVLAYTMLTVLLGGACLGAIIYVVLKDEKRNVGILRALGAKKTQIAALLSVRILVSGGIGIALGSSVFLLLRELEKKIVYVEDTSKEYAGMGSVLLIPVLGILILLVMQLPAIFALLKETPAEQMDERTYTGESLISYKNRRIFKVKHPIWWYSGLENRRLRGRSVAMALITVVGMLLPVFYILYLEVTFERNAREAMTETYTIEKETGFFTEDEVKQILAIPGVCSAGFPEERRGTEVAEYLGEPLDVRLQILDEMSFERMKIFAEKKGIVVPAETGEELLREEGILLRHTFHTIRGGIQCGDEVTLLSPGGEPFPYEVVYVAENEGEGDADYYLFVSYETYCRVYGTPDLKEFTVLLKNTGKAEAEKSLCRIGDGIFITMNDLLIGNTEEELNSDAVVWSLMLCFVEFLSAVVFLFCYNSFYYLAKLEEYRKLYAMGASKKMIRKSILYQSVRVSALLALVTVAIAYALYRYVIFAESDEWIRENVSRFPAGKILFSLVIVAVVSMSAAWFAAGQVKRELEKTA